MMNWIPSKAALLSVALLLLAPAALSAATARETLRQATAKEASGDLREALRLYRKLLKRYPDRADLVLRVESILYRTGRRNDAVRLLASHLQKRPGDSAVRFRLADIQSETGNLDGAIAHWNRIVADATDTGTFERVARNFLRHNLPSRALSVCRRGRDILKNPHLFAGQMAEITERLARYPDAVAEYLVFVRQQPQLLGHVETRFRHFAREGDQQDRTLATLGREAREHPDDDIALRLFTEYALAAGLEDRALRVFAAFPRIGPHHVTHLLRVGEHAFEAGRFAPAAQAYALLLAGPSAIARQPEAMLGLGKASEGLSRADTAASLYRSLIDGFPETLYAHEAGFRLGLLLRRVYRDTAAALDAFRSVAGAKRRTSWRYHALFEIADILVVADRLTEARSVYVRVARERQDREDAARARFGIAECHFLSGDVDAARTVIDSMLSGSPNGFSFNDALGLSVLLEQGSQEGDAVLQSFASASKLVRRQQPDAALAAYREFAATHPKSRLLDRALASQIALLDTLGRYNEAILVSRRLLESVPWSPLCPGAMVTVGRIYDLRLGQYQDALKTYESVLSAYPHSLEAEEAREQARALREKIRFLDTTRKEPG
ncbi:MAG: tetratricopeptide repeat protein [Gemmatimonadota bacterium]|nr:tetratricopeptide repeat protein [Gemmatimonadota bacterium]